MRPYVGTKMFHGRGLEGEAEGDLGEGDVGLFEVDYFGVSAVEVAEGVGYEEIALHAFAAS